jgi:hypothetical protein
MTRFREIVLNEEEETVEIGAGLSWIDVYSYLVPKGLSVVGSRTPGVGVSGHTIAGGKHYSSLLRMHRVFLNVVPACQDIPGRPINLVSP